MSTFDKVKQSVDVDVTNAIASRMQKGMKSVLLAPYNCMQVAIISCFMLGKTYTKLVILIIVICGTFSAGGAIYTMWSADFVNITYSVAGVLAALFMFCVLRRDNKHRLMVEQAQRYGSGTVEPYTVSKSQGVSPETEYLRPSEPIATPMPYVIPEVYTQAPPVSNYYASNVPPVEYLDGNDSDDDDVLD